VPRLPSADATTGIGLSSGGTVRITTGTNRRLRLFAVTQIAASFVLLAGSGMLLATLFALQQTRTGFDMERVLAIDVPIVSYERKPQEIVGFYKKCCAASRRCLAWSARRLAPSVPWRDKGVFGPGFQFSVQGYTRANGEEGSARQVQNDLARLLPRAGRARSSPGATSAKPTATTPRRS
jgi:hypothetical protein